MRARLRAPDLVAGGSGVALLVSLFLPWYAAGDLQASATEAFAVIDLWLLLLAAAGIALAVVTALRDAPAPAVAADVLTTWIGIVAVPLVLLRILDVPADGVDRAWGLWVGAACVLGVTAGAYRAMRVEAAPGLRPNPVPEPLPEPAGGAPGA